VPHRNQSFCRQKPDSFDKPGKAVWKKDKPGRIARGGGGWRQQTCGDKPFKARAA